MNFEFILEWFFSKYFNLSFRKFKSLIQPSNQQGLRPPL